MPRLPLHPSSGTGQVTAYRKAIRFVRYGCANRPFYHIVVMDLKLNQHRPPIEQLGSYDPMPNKHNEQLVALNLERLQYWLGQKPSISTPVATLLGLAGFFPIHPMTYMTAWRRRRQRDEASKNPDPESDAKAEAAG